MLTKLVPRNVPHKVKCIPFIRTLSDLHNMSSTIDSNEVQQFQKLSSTWWDPMGEMKALHSMNQVRVPLVRDGLVNIGAIKKEFIDTPTPLKDLTILEVGCGGGILTEALARLGSTITGIDATPSLIEQAIEHAKLDSGLSSITYSVTSIEEHAKTHLAKYDAVVSSEVLEHVTEKEMFIAACVQCLKPGGSIFITTLNKTLFSWVGGIVFAEYVLNLVPKGTHEWDKFIAPHQVQKMLEDNNCRTRLVHGMCYNVLTNSWGWISNTSINYALHAVKNH